MTGLSDNHSMKIGCDPEFMPIMNPYGAMQVGNFHVNKRNRDGHVGDDHGGDVGELRPTPGSPREVTERIRRMLLGLVKRKTLIDILGGGGTRSNSISIGGHIHFDIRLTSKYGDRFGNTDDEISVDDLCTQDAGLIRALDKFIGIPLSKKKGGQRGDSDYGHPSDIRLAWHGNEQGFEYRTPPSWLTTPNLTEGVLWTALSIADIHVNKPELWYANSKLWKGRGKKLRPRDFEILINAASKRGKKFIKIYVDILFDRKFELNRPGSITDWTGKKPLDLLEF